MNPLTITYSPHIYTDWGFKNFRAWIDTGFDNFLFTPNIKSPSIAYKIVIRKFISSFSTFYVWSKLFNTETCSTKI